MRSCVCSGRASAVVVLSLHPACPGPGSLVSSPPSSSLSSSQFFVLWAFHYVDSLAAMCPFLFAVVPQSTSSLPCFKTLSPCGQQAQLLSLSFPLLWHTWNPSGPVSPGPAGKQDSQPKLTVSEGTAKQLDSEEHLNGGRLHLVSGALPAGESRTYPLDRSRQYQRHPSRPLSKVPLLSVHCRSPPARVPRSGFGARVPGPGAQGPGPSREWSAAGGVENVQAGWRPGEGAGCGG